MLNMLQTNRSYMAYPMLIPIQWHIQYQYMAYPVADNIWHIHTLYDLYATKNIDKSSNPEQNIANKKGRVTASIKSCL